MYFLIFLYWIPSMINENFIKLVVLNKITWENKYYREWFLQYNLACYYKNDFFVIRNGNLTLFWAKSIVILWNRVPRIMLNECQIIEVQRWFCVWNTLLDLLILSYCHDRYWDIPWPRLVWRWCFFGRILEVIVSPLW